MNFRSLKKIAFLWWFIPLSLALHLLLLLLIPEKSLQPPPEKDEPVMVEVRPPQEESRPRELDVPPQPEQPEPREEPAKRLGPQDVEVEEETAPKGEDAEDMSPPVVTAPPQPLPTPAPTEPRETEPDPEEKTEPAEAEEPAEHTAERHEAERAPQAVTEPESEQSPAATPDRQLPEIDELLDLPQSTAKRIEGEERRKKRPEVAEGDAIWLDTEKDLLISFFQRFKNNIYGVWNYPTKAAERGEQGTSLLRVTVRRDGTVESVKLIESSGANTLDREAIRAVWTGAPYGPLPRAYEEETLTIFAFFQYTLGGRPFVHGGR